MLRDSPVSKTVIASPLIYRNIRYTIEMSNNNRLWVRVFKAPEIVEKYFTFLVIIRPVNINWKRCPWKSIRAVTTLPARSVLESTSFAALFGWIRTGTPADLFEPGDHVHWPPHAMQTLKNLKALMAFGSAVNVNGCQRDSHGEKQ